MTERTGSAQNCGTKFPAGTVLRGGSSVVACLALILGFAAPSLATQNDPVEASGMTQPATGDTQGTETATAAATDFGATETNEPTAEALQAPISPFDATQPAEPEAATPRIDIMERGAAGASMGQGIKGGSTAARNSRSAPAAPYATSWTPPGVLGMDVSGHQPTIDWALQSRLGAKFAYVKATEGINFTSKFFPSQYQGSYNAGMIRGAYHFALPNESSGRAQADYFVNNGGGWSADGRTLPPLLDVEYNPYYQYGNSCYNMSASQMVQWIRDFSDRVLALTNRRPMIYTTTDWWVTCTANSTAFADHPLHIAAYPYNLETGFQRGPGSLPKAWSRYDVWQFSDQWQLAGDSNVWRGTLAELKAFAQQSDVTLNPPPQESSGKAQSLGIGDYNSDGRQDLLQSRTDGTLWLYPGNNNGTYGAAVRIGTGFNVYTMLTPLGDFNKDGRPDFAGIRADGSWWFYPGTGVVNATNNGYKPAIRTTANFSGFLQVLGVGDLNGDRRADVAGVKSDGSLWLFPGSGTVSTTSTGMGAGVKIGNGGWNAFSTLVRAMDADNDGSNDILAVDRSGALWLYPGTGKASTTANAFGSRIKIGNSGWDKFSAVIGAGDLNADGVPDIMGRYPDASYVFYAGSTEGANGYRPARKVGNGGWQNFKQVVPAGDFNGDGKADLVGVRYDGQLYFYAGNGTGGYGSARLIGKGWNIYQSVHGVGDFNSDGRADLLAVRPDGTLWFYAGTGRITANDEGYARALNIGRSGWNSFTQVLGTGDMSADGRGDLVARRSDGSVWLYKGTGKVGGGQTGYMSGIKLASGTMNGLVFAAAVHDFNQDGRNDVVGTKADGSLWLLPGTGAAGTNGTFAAARQIGRSGWLNYSEIVGVGDSTGDGLPDLVGVHKNGSLWHYTGTGMNPEIIRPGVQAGFLR